MEKKVDIIIQQIDEICSQYKELINKNSGKYIYQKDFPTYKLYQHYTSLSDAIIRFSPKGSQYYVNVKKLNRELNILDAKQINQAAGACYHILVSLKNAYLKGYLEILEEEINAKIFSDFLEMAEYFLDSGDQYKHPAAFLIGNVIEEHLRKLSIKNGIEVQKENGKFRHAEDLNIDLRSKGVYDLNEQKSITSWLGLRNDADHAHWNKYSKEKVEVMLKDVKRLIKQYPA